MFAQIFSSNLFLVFYLPYLLNHNMCISYESIFKTDIKNVFYLSYSFIKLSY